MAFAILAIAAGATAQQPAFTRTVLQQADLSVPGREAVTASIVFEPGGVAGRHTHPGEEIGFVVEGAVLLEQDGKSPVTYTAGQAFFIPAGTVHGGTSTGSTGARLVSTYVVEKGKPLTMPAAR